MTPLVRALPAELRAMLAEEVLEYLVSVARESQDQDASDTACLALDEALTHIVYGAPERFLPLQNQHGTKC